MESHHSTETDPEREQPISPVKLSKPIRQTNKNVTLNDHADRQIDLAAKCA